MAKRYRLTIASVIVLLGVPAFALTIVCWSAHLEAHARGSDVEWRILSPLQWGFGEGDNSIQVASAKISYTDPHPLKSWDTRRRIGILEMTERRWIPMDAPFPQ